MNLAGIYALQDPNTYEIRYIGLGSNWKKRSQSHLQVNAYSKSQLPVYRWVRKLINSGKSPLIIGLQEFQYINYDDLKNAEKYWIQYFKNISSHNLLNCTDGGEGIVGYSHKEVTKKKISNKLKGLKRSLEICQKLSNIRKGKPKLSPFTDEHKIKISQNHGRVKRVVDNFGNIYRSVTEASVQLNISRQSVTNNLIGISKIVDNKYKFQYVGVAS